MSGKGESPGMRDSGGVAAVDRALQLLAAFKPEDRGLTLADLATRTGFYKSTILRLAESLLRHGYLQRLDDGRFQIGPAPLLLSSIYQRSLRLSDVILPLLSELRDGTRETASFYIRQGELRVCLFRTESQHAIRQHELEGDVVPLDRGASGRIFAAFSGAEGSPYDTIRHAHYYISRGDRDPDMSGIAVQIFGPHQRLIGAIAIGGPSTRVDQAFLESARGRLLDAAIRATVALGGNADSLVAARSEVETDRRPVGK